MQGFAGGIRLPCQLDDPADWIGALEPVSDGVDGRTGRRPDGLTGAHAGTTVLIV